MTGHAEFLTKFIVAPLAKAILKTAGLDEAVETGVVALNEAAKGLDAEDAKRKARELTETLAADTARRHARQFAEDGTPVDTKAVAEALATLFKDAAKPKGLLSRNLDPARLAEDLAQAPPPATFGTAERELYEAVLPDLAYGLMVKAAELKEFDLAFRRDVLERHDETNRRLGDVERLVRGDERKTKEWVEYERRYRAHIAAVNNHLELFGSDLPDEAKRQTLSVAYVSLALTRHGASDEEVESVTAEHLFDSLGEIGGRLLIRGDAGGGKTTLLRWATVKSGEAVGRGENAERFDFLRAGDPVGKSLVSLKKNLKNIPLFLIRLRDCDGGIPGVEHLAGAATEVLGQPPVGWIVDSLDSGRALVMLDGVDEVARFDRPRYAEAIGRLVVAYPKAKFIVTSRPAAVEAGWLAKYGFADATIAPLAPHDQSELIVRWHRAMAEIPNEQRKATLAVKEQRLRDRLDRTPSLARLGSNPLMLSMLCALNYRLESDVPDRPFELCDKLCTLLVDEKDRESRLRKEVMHPVWAGLDGKRKRALMRELAFYLVDGPGRSIGSSMAVETADGILSRILEAFGHPTSEIEPFRHDVVVRCGLLRESAPGRIDFLHNTLKEFLAAEHFIEMRLEEKLAARAGDPDWRPVILFGAGGGSPPFVDCLFTLIADAAASAGAKTKAGRRLRVMAWAVGTVAVRLSPRLRPRHAALEKTLIPPKTFEEAELLAEAGEQVLDHLIAASPRGGRAIAATARALLRIGSARARATALERFGSDERKAVLDELAPFFNPLTLPGVQRRLLKGQGLENGWRRFVTDLWALVELSRLQTLDLRGAGVTDVSALAGLDGLQALDLSETGVTDVSALAGLSGLDWLDLGVTRVTDVSALAGLSGLQTLFLDGTDVTDVSALAGLSGLQALFLGGTGVTDVSVLAGLSGLQELNLAGTGVTDVSALAGLNGLQTLNLAATGVTDVSALAGLSGLQTLDLGETGVMDVSALVGLNGLQRLDLSETDVTDVSPLESLPNLQTLVHPDGRREDRQLALESSTQLHGS